MAESKRVLIVEDDAAIAALLARALGRYYDVRVVTDGAVAAPVAVTYQPDVVLLDVNLPNQDGYAVAGEMKETPLLRQIPIVFLTAQQGTKDVVRGIQSGARHYLTKPFSLEEVLSKVQRLAPSAPRPGASPSGTMPRVAGAEPTAPEQRSLAKRS